MRPLPLRLCHSVLPDRRGLLTRLESTVLTGGSFSASSDMSQDHVMYRNPSLRTAEEKSDRGVGQD